MSNKEVYLAIAYADIIFDSLIGTLCSQCGNCNEHPELADCAGSDARKAWGRLRDAEDEMLKRMNRRKRQL